MYTALYRQWRPNTFDTVVGQEAVIRTLRNQILTGRVAHAYLFCGSRGTGKTSTAKIFSKAINCLSPTEAGPCGECSVCTRLSSENNMDIIEIDAASNNGVDEIRDLREKVKFPPTAGRYKVYIIDEVHMLSIGAFNALLKTLEEPPAHVVFILATTEPHKLPATIVSRCQRYDFKRIPAGVMVGRMKDICRGMGVEVEEAGLYTIARWAEGGMRDALSLLDQVVGFCGNRITNEDILSVLGTADQGFIFDAVEDLINGDSHHLLLKLGRLTDDGKDLTVFLREMIHHLRNLLVVKLCSKPDTLLDAEPSMVEMLAKQASSAGHSRLIRAIEILTNLEAELKWSTQPRVLFELAVVKICRPQLEDSMEALLDRIETLEQQIKSGTFQPVVQSLGCGKTGADAAQASQPVIPGNAGRQAAADETDIPDYQIPLPGEGDIPDFEESMSGSLDDPAMAGGFGREGSFIEQGNPDAAAGKAAGPRRLPSGRREPGRGTLEKSDNKDQALKEHSKPESIHKDSSQGQSSPDGSALALKDPEEAWPEVMKAVKKERFAIYALLNDVKPDWDGGNNFVLAFAPDQGFFYAAVEKEENRTFLEGLLQRITGRQLKLKCRLGFEPETKKRGAEENDAVKQAIQAFGPELVEVVEEE